MHTIERNNTISTTTDLRYQIPLPPGQCCFLQMSKDQGCFRTHNNIASKGRGEGRTRYSEDVRKNALRMYHFLNSFVQDCSIKDDFQEMEHPEFPIGTFRRENWTTFSDVLLLLLREVFLWNDPKSRAPFIFLNTEFLNFERLLVTDFCFNDFSEIPLAYLLCQLKPIPEISVKNISKFFY